MGVLCFKSGHHAEICWLSPKNDLNSVMLAGSGKALIASKSSGSGLISTSPPLASTMNPPNFTLVPYLILLLENVSPCALALAMTCFQVPMAASLLMPCTSTSATDLRQKWSDEQFSPIGLLVYLY